MNREQLIQSIVARKLSNMTNQKKGCVPCFGSASFRRPQTKSAR